MKKLFLALALISALVVPGLALAGHVSAQANFTSSRYKFAGITHTETGDPSWSGVNAGVTMSVQYWSFTDFGSHALVQYSMANWNPDVTTSYGMQVGLAVGYDPWGNVLVDNYPIGIWSEANHPNDGHLPGAQTYVPNAGHWRIVRYAEKFPTGSAYRWQSISVFGLSAGQTVKLRHDGVNTFSMVDQNNNVLGMLDHVNIPQWVSQPGYRLDAMEEDYSPLDSWLDFGIYVLQGFQNPTGLFWNGYTGCSANGFNGDNALDPNCRGGATALGAPLDIWRQMNPNWQQVQMYCQECETTGPPFSPINPSAAYPAADNPTGGTVTGTPKKKEKDKTANWHGEKPSFQPSSDTPGSATYGPPYVAP